MQYKHPTHSWSYTNTIFLLGFSSSYIKRRHPTPSPTPSPIPSPTPSPTQHKCLPFPTSPLHSLPHTLPHSLSPTPSPTPSPTNTPYSPVTFPAQVNDGEVVSWVKVSLMNQRRAVKTKKTTVVAACDEPQYNESFHFRPPPALEGVHITLQLYVASSSNSKG